MRAGGDTRSGDSEAVLDVDGREIGVILHAANVYRLWWHESDATDGRRREVLLGSYPSLAQARSAAARFVTR